MKKNGSIGGTGKMRPPHVKRLGAALEKMQLRVVERYY